MIETNHRVILEDSPKAARRYSGAGLVLWYLVLLSLPGLECSEKRMALDLRLGMSIASAQEVIKGAGGGSIDSASYYESGILKLAFRHVSLPTVDRPGRMFLSFTKGELSSFSWVFEDHRIDTQAKGYASLRDYMQLSAWSRSVHGPPSDSGSAQGVVGSTLYVWWGDRNKKGDTISWIHFLRSGGMSSLSLITYYSSGEPATSGMN